MSGLLDNLTEASHVAAGLGCTFEQALKIVAEAHKPQTASEEDSNVIYGVDFGTKRADHE